jgi:hypothetical protein
MKKQRTSSTHSGIIMEREGRKKKGVSGACSTKLTKQSLNTNKERECKVKAVD